MRCVDWHIHEVDLFLHSHTKIDHFERFRRSIERIKYLFLGIGSEILSSKTWNEEHTQFSKKIRLIISGWGSPTKSCSWDYKNIYNIAHITIVALNVKYLFDKRKHKLSQNKS